MVVVRGKITIGDTDVTRGEDVPEVSINMVMDVSFPIDRVCKPHLLTQRSYFFFSY